MLESAVELLGGLFFGAVVLLIGFCAVGSMVAALRAVSREGARSPIRPEALAAANRTEGFARTLLARQAGVGHQMNPGRKA
jgi:hypothetical protein